MKTLRLRLPLASPACFASLALSHAAERPDALSKGKTSPIVVGSGPGGRCGAIAQLLAEHLDQIAAIQIIGTGDRTG